MKNIIGLCAMLGLLSACSHEVAVTYDCVPRGATLIEQNVGTLGTCPVTVKYNVDDVKVSDNKLYTDEIEVVWVSGQKLYVDPMSIDLGKDYHGAFTFNRPQTYVHFEGDDSMDKDERYAVAYEAGLPSTEVKYVQTPGQKRGFFDRFNTAVVCLYDGISENPHANCD